MKQYLKYDNWKIIEDKFHPEYNRITESIMSLGNGRMGHRANFEEQFTGDTLQGNYIAGIYYPDKTRVGWWKNGYPEYFAKVLNAANWAGINIKTEEEPLNLDEADIHKFRRELNMKEGYLLRNFTAELQSGKKIEVSSTRFLSIVTPEIGALKYSLKALNFSGEITIMPYVDLDVINEDSNYNEKFWTEVKTSAGKGYGYVTSEVRKTLFQLISGMKFRILRNHRKRISCF